jgi:hypothetical protein
MREELERVLALQADYSPSATPEMRERGRLVRDEAPAWLRDDESALSGAMGIPVADCLVEGRDGTGLKTRVAWFRFASSVRSPRATDGFYVVYLFSASGDAVYLSLNQGTTDFNGVDFVRKPEPVLQARVSWARSVLADWLASRADIVEPQLQDRRGGLGEGYEIGNIAAVRYAQGAVPTDEALRADARDFAVALGALYAAHADAPVPHESPELEYAMDAIAAATGRTRPARSAGFSTNAEQNRAVERRAVEVATAYYKADGWTVKDVGATKPYDLDLRRGADRLTVEVKGTTSDGMNLSLTDGEVRHHRAAYPNNALVVVRNIALDRAAKPPVATGGELYEVRPWDIEAEALRPLAYRYAVPLDAYADGGFPSELLV